MNKNLALKAKDPKNCWIAIDIESGIIVSEGKSPLEASENVKSNKDVVLSFVTNDSESYIF